MFKEKELATHIWPELKPRLKGSIRSMWVLDGERVDIFKLWALAVQPIIDREGYILAFPRNYRNLQAVASGLRMARAEEEVP